MPNIVYIIPQIKVGGAETLFKELSECSHNKFILYKYCLQLNSNNPIQYFISLLNFVFFVKKNKIEIVVSSLWKAHLFSLLIKWCIGTKAVPFIHSSAYFNVFDKVVTRLILARSDKCLTDSIVTEEFIQLQFLSIKIFRVSTFLRFNLKSDNKKYYYANPLQLKFLFLGRIAKVKRIDKSIDFLNHLRDSLPLNTDIIFDLYGPIELSQKIIDDWKKSAKFTINFNHSLEREELPEIFVAYDFYLQMSDVEGMAMSVIEAMSLGIIPIVTKVGEIANYCEHRFNCFCYDPAVETRIACQDLLQSYSNAEYLNEISENAIKSTSQYNDFRVDFIKKISQLIS